MQKQKIALMKKSQDRAKLIEGLEVAHQTLFGKYDRKSRAKRKEIKELIEGLKSKGVFSKFAFVIFVYEGVQYNYDRVDYYQELWKDAHWKKYEGRPLTEGKDYEIVKEKGWTTRQYETYTPIGFYDKKLLPKVIGQTLGGQKVDRRYDIVAVLENGKFVLRIYNRVGTDEWDTQTKPQGYVRGYTRTHFSARKKALMMLLNKKWKSG